MASALERARPSPQVQQSDLILRLAPGGLETAEPSLHSSGQIEFGQEQAQVIERIAAIRGRPTRSGHDTECGAGAMEFTAFGPLRVNFQGGRFVGWLLDGPADPPIEEEYGLAIGSPRRDLAESDQGAAQFSRTSLGTEFDMGGIRGLMTSDRHDAVVLSLYAGTNCLFR